MMMFECLTASLSLSPLNHNSRQVDPHQHLHNFEHRGRWHQIISNNAYRDDAKSLPYLLICETVFHT